MPKIYYKKLLVRVLRNDKKVKPKAERIIDNRLLEN